jgi:hypothetical protein
MKRTITVETSYYSTNPTKRWSYGGDYWEEDVTLEYPEELDHLDDNELCEKADNEQDGVKYLPY